MEDPLLIQVMELLNIKQFDKQSDSESSKAYN